MGQYTIEQVENLVSELNETKNSLKDAIESKGVTVGDANLDEFPSLVNNIFIPTISETKSVTYTSNGNYTVEPNSGDEGIASVNVNVDVPNTYKNGDNIIYYTRNYKISKNPINCTINGVEHTGITNFDFTKNTIYNILIKNNESILNNTFNASELYNIYIEDEVSSCNNLFKDSKNLISVNLKTNNVKDFSSMFRGCDKLIYVEGLDTTNATTLSNMFYNCFEIEYIQDFNTPNLVNLNNIFYHCESLKRAPNIDTGKVTSFSFAFRDCLSLNYLPSYDLTSCVSTSYMLYNCSSLTNLPVLDTSKCTNMGNMLYGCLSLERIEGLDFSSLTTSPSYFFNIVNPPVNLTHFILNGTLNFSIVSTNTILRACAYELDYETIKSWLTAASKSEISDLTLDFISKDDGARTITDQNGELAALVETCTSKGWTIQNLTIL